MGFLDDFFGKSQKRDIEQGAQQQRAALGQGFEDARGIYGDYLNRGLGYLDSGIQGGQGANKLLYDALGINGADAQRGFYSGFQQDPGFQATLDAGLRGVQGSAAARGNLLSGAAMKGLYDFGQRAQQGAFQDRLNRLSGVGQAGNQMSMAAAGMNTQAGQDLSNLRYGYGQQLGNSYMSEANARAGTRGMGFNNLLAIGNMAGKFFGGK